MYGLILGLVGCFVCSITRIWNNGFKRAAAVFFTGLAIMWLGLKLSYLGASSVGCLSLTVLVSIAWERGFPPRLCKGKHKACSLCLFWCCIGLWPGLQPFCLAGHPAVGLTELAFSMGSIACHQGCGQPLLCSVTSGICEAPELTCAVSGEILRLACCLS